MTTLSAERVDELFRQPADDALPALRAAGLLPERTTEQIWTPNAADVQPTVAALAQLDPRHPYTAGKASMTAYGPQWFHTGGSADVSIRSQAGSLSGIVYFTFSNLGANRKCIVWFDLRVNGPSGSSITLGGSGNPSTVVVTFQATGGQRTWVPLALTASSSGQAIAYMVPTLSGHGGAWYGSSVYGL